MIIQNQLTHDKFEMSLDSLNICGTNLILNY